MGKAFPAQFELILRSRNRVRYVRVPRPVRVVFVVLVAAGFGWTAYSSQQFLSHKDVVSQRDARIAQLGDRNDALSTSVRTLRGRIESQRRSLTETRRLEQENEDLRRRVASRDLRLAAVEAQRENLGTRVSELSGRLEMVETAQVDVVSRLGEQADRSGQALKRALDLTGLDIDRLLDRMARDAEREHGIGGPLLALSDNPGSELAQKMAMAGRRVVDQQSLQALMEHLPLIAPLDEYRQTSGFGRRVDPFTKRPAFHAGMDLASRRQAPVRVTSPGTVTFVGWKGGFGKLVEVDHGLGVRTRYGHLSMIFVKRGQKLEFREKVGLTGSTGRSTGEHLHYEIVIDGRSHDPADFIKAGQHVFKG